MQQLEARCHAVLQAADRLLERYPRMRLRSGDSLAGKILYPCLPLLRGLEALLSTTDANRLQQMEAALSERLALLRRRRIPLSAQLHRFRSRCRELILTYPRVAEVWDSPSVLVGALRSPHQLDVCREHGFYHVPARQFPNDWLPISYIAVYQSMTMFPENCGVFFYGRVTYCSPVRRWQIREIPKNSDELYYRLEVDSWEQLEQPIAIREIPVVHLRTNLFLLKNSLEIPDLTLRTPEHYIFYHALKYALDLGDGIVFRHRKGTVRLKDGLFQIHRFKRKIAAWRTEDFNETPALIFREMMDILEKKPS